MLHKQDHLLASDGIRLFWQAWEPEGPVRATVCLVHGLGEHSGRYLHVAQAFTNAGLSLQAIDLRGHGLSEGPRGHTPSHIQWLDDISLFLSRAHHGPPRFLYGHSLGGILIISFGLSRSENLDGVISTGPVFRISAEVPTLKAALGRLMASIWPTFSQASGLIPADLSHDPAVVQAYVDDPMVHDRISSRFFVDMVTAGEEALERAADFRMPILLMHAEIDRLADRTATEEFHATVGSSDKTLRIWPGMFHEVHNEPDKEHVLEEIIEWVVKRCD
jgi:alpha-beta hydrolase superfamily lysophospholipase